MTIVIAALALTAWFGLNVAEKREKEILRCRLEEYGPGEVIG